MANFTLCVNIPFENDFNESAPLISIWLNAFAYINVSFEPGVPLTMPMPCPANKRKVLKDRSAVYVPPVVMIWLKDGFVDNVDGIDHLVPPEPSATNA